MNYNFVAMLQDLHAAGIEVTPIAGESAHSWHARILGLVEFHCMPTTRDSANETADISYRNRGWLGKAGEWKAPYAPSKQIGHHSSGRPKYKQHSNRANRSR